MNQSNDSIGEKIIKLHEELRSSFPALSRMAIAIYDKDNDYLKTFVNSTKQHHPLNNYSVSLSDVPSLKKLADTGQHRVIHDLRQLKDSNSTHTKWLLQEGFRSSYTVPLYSHDQLVGFLFFDADKPKYFDLLIIKSLNVYAELIGSILVNELAPIFTLRGALNTAQHLTHHRDSETACHIARMSHYSHLLAQKLSARYSLTDEYIEYILQYSPLHDVGKIAISDEILLKPGRLTAEEFAIIKTHVQKGLEIIHSIIDEFDLAGLKHLSILYNIIGCHHEKYDGSGYPDGLTGSDIPLEGRIVAVADVLDALSNPRPYKQAWSFEKSVDFIVDQSGRHFDPDCCNILDNNRDEFHVIFKRFSED